MDFIDEREATLFHFNWPFIFTYLTCFSYRLNGIAFIEDLSILI